MVRLVFRPYTKLCKAICTSAHVRASTRVSSGFALVRHSSPSFGSHRTRFLERTRLGTACVSLSLRRRVWCPPTRASDGLLGPCFKTGRLRRKVRKTRADAEGKTSQGVPRVGERTRVRDVVESGSACAVSGTFHSLSKVLFSFPSRYFFAIGFPLVFNLGWRSPPFRTAISNSSTLADAD